MIITYSVEDGSNPTKLYNYFSPHIIGNNIFDKIEIDDVEVSISDIDTAEGMYQLPNGEHTVKYTLKDPTTIAEALFVGCMAIKEVIIPDNVETVENMAFDTCSNLLTATIGSGVRRLGTDSFYLETNQSVSFYLKSTTPPICYDKYDEFETDSYPFETVDEVVLYVPSSSLNVYKSAEGWTKYENQLFATPTNSSLGPK